MITHAWHFLPDNERLHRPHGKRKEYRLIYPKTTLTVKPPVVLCKHGLHASVRALDALKYAKGSVICRVECSGAIETAADKLVCQRRKVLWMASIERELHEFACWCAEITLKHVTDARCWRALEVKRAWLDGEATDGDLADAQSAATDAGWSSMVLPARRAAWIAAWASSRPPLMAARETAAMVTRYSFADWFELNAELERVLIKIGGSDEP